MHKSQSNAVMFGSATFRYYFIRTSIIFLESVAPASAGYCVLVLAGLIPFDLIPFHLGWWTVAETLFYLPIFWWQKYYLQRPAQHPPLRSKEERRQLFTRCFGLVKDPEQYLSKWFLGAPLTAIKRDNVKEFVRWAFFDADVVDSIYDDEVEQCVVDFEHVAKIKFEPGRSDVKCLRLTLDHVNIRHRSLTWYMCIAVVDTIAHFSMWFHRFHYYRVSAGQTLAVFPPRPLTLIASSPSPVRDTSYWYRPHTARNRKPVLFLHGIGVGLYPYVDFLAQLNRGKVEEEGEVGIIALEILPISSRITNAAPGKEATCRQIQAILNHHGWSDVVLVSHSYGSVLVAQILQSLSLTRHIASVVLVDPVSILLHFPDVAYNFTIRKPETADEWLLYYFGAKDMGTAHTLGRRFFWSENIIWKEDLTKLRASVFLSERDDIINTRQVYEYLRGEGEEGGDGRLKVVECKQLHHGQAFDLKVWREVLVMDVLEHTVGAPAVSHEGVGIE